MSWIVKKSEGKGKKVKSEGGMGLNGEHRGRRGKKEGTEGLGNTVQFLFLFGIQKLSDFFRVYILQAKKYINSNLKPYISPI